MLSSLVWSIAMLMLPFFLGGGGGGRRVVPENAEWQPGVFAARQSLLPAISPCDVCSKPVR